MASINQRPISIRPAAVAGSFYPADRNELNKILEQCLDGHTVDTEPPKAIIAPHAGYIYSGPVAANAYANVAKLNSRIRRVILLGPAHRVYVEGVALVSNTHFSTPLGNVSLDYQLMDELNQLPFVEVMDNAHAQEHSIEVHIPFLQKVLDNFVLIPILVGNAKPGQISEILDKLWGGDETLIVISSDLSHFLNYEQATEIDSITTQHIENFEFEQIGPKQACGCMPMRGLLKLAKEKNMRIETLDLRNSGDTAGNKERVVGYGAYALYPGNSLNEEDQKTIFETINKSIKSGLENGKAYKPRLTHYPDHLQQKRAVFITLKLNNQLRGCIGTTDAHSSLIEAVAHYAHAAAFSDPRFKPLTNEEYEKIDISLSVLTPATPMTFKDEQDLIKQLRPNTDGIIISKGGARATFLPVVWESLSKPEQFIAELKRKAGIKNTDCPDKAWRYTSEYYQK